tara:strand:- start:42 stop:950 length:909 start_codon:yes stop_codon:yes gene_type:complete
MGLGIAGGITKNRGPEETRYFARARRGASFDGANDYCYKAYAANMNFGNDDSASNTNIIFATFKVDNVNTHDTVCYWADATTGDKLTLGITVGGGYLQFNVYNDNDAGTGLVGVRSTSSVSNDTWYHCVGQRGWNDDGEGLQSNKFWINGVLQTGTYSSTNVTFPALKSGAGRDGSSGSLGSDYWGGDMQEMGFIHYPSYNLKTDEDVESLYNNGHPRNPRYWAGPYQGYPLASPVGGLLDYYNFDGIGNGAGGADNSYTSMPDKAGGSVHTSNPSHFDGMLYAGISFYADGSTNMNGDVIG